MRNLVVKAWMTLDGIFDADNMDKWFNAYHSDDRANIIQNRVLASDAFIYGRITYEMLAPYWSSLENNEMGIADHLNKAPKYVVTSTLTEPEWNNSTIINGNVVEEITKLKQQPGEDILVDGSATLVQSLMETDIIDEFHLLVHPIIMGRGNAFFKDGVDTTKLELVEATTISLGVVLLRYEVAGNQK